MVAGKVKAAMGLQRSPATPKMQRNSSKNQQTKGSGGGGGVPFSRYFPRSSAQVQPENVSELRERESRLRAEILELRVSKESAVAAMGKRVEWLEEEKERLNRENEFLRMKMVRQNREQEERIEYMQAELSEIKRAVVVERRLVEEEEEASSSLMDQRCKLGKSVRCSMKCVNENGSSVENEEIPETKSRRPRVPNPPPRPSATSSSSSSSVSHSSSCDYLSDISNIPPPPPPPPPPSKRPTSVKSPPPPPPPPARKPAPPPPPPPPPKGLNPKPTPAKVRRVPEVVEFYHSLMRRDTTFRRDPGGGSTTPSEIPAAAKDMIGEIENRSAHLLAIKTDVKTQGEFIRFLIKEVEGASFSDIEDVVSFVKWLDDELSFLVDERAVLKHFDWPEKKADAMREAAFGYCDLKKLELEASFCDDPRQPCALALRKMQSLLEKLEHSVYSLLRMRESATRRYQLYQIPMNWMLDAGFVSQMKLASVKLAMKYMKRVSSELGMLGPGGPEEEELILQAVRFAFRVHQFAGGFNVETMRAFQELKNKAQCCRRRSDQSQLQKTLLLHRSSGAFVTKSGAFHV